MSRCFPFPPPGYERKRDENDSLLAKDKGTEEKEKVHPRDKDKEKKEGRGKDKERSKEKRREKDKEKKEKHKHKDRDKKKEKKRSRDEKRFEGERSQVEKAGSNSPQSNQVKGTPLVGELEHIICYVDDATGTQTVHKVNARDQGKAELLDRLAGSNIASWSEGKSGFDQKANGQGYHYQTKCLKVAFVRNSNGVEQQTADIHWSTENKIDRLTEGEDLRKHHISDEKGGKKQKTNDKRYEGQAEIYTSQKLDCSGAQVHKANEDIHVQELERRIRDESDATRSQVGAQANGSIQRRVQSDGKLSNGNVPSQIKENLMFGNDNFRIENGQKNSVLSNGPKVTIVHNSKVLEHRGSQMAGPNVKSKKARMEGVEKNGFIGIGTVDSRVGKILPKDEVRNKSREEEKVKEGGERVVKLSRVGGNVCDSDNSRPYVFKEGNKAAGGVTGKRKEPEANGILHENEKRPSKWQKTVLSSEQVPENGRRSQSGTTITLSATKQRASNGLYSKEHKVNGTMGAPSPFVSTKSPSAIGMIKSPPSSAKVVGPVRLQSPQNSTKLPVSPKANGPLITVKDNGVVCAERPSSAAAKASGFVRAQSPLNPATLPVPAKANGPPRPVKVNGIIGAQETALGPTKPPLSTVKVQERICSQEPPLGSVKPPSTTPEANGHIGVHESPSNVRKPSSSGKEKRKSKSSSKQLQPHPDTKYLSQILSVPKMEECPQSDDDSNWLFDSKRFSSSKEADADCTREQQVWAKAFHIESADVFALPYVIPY